MELNFSKKEKITGTFLIIISVLLFTTVIIIGRGQYWFRTYLTYYTVFDESYNLQINAEVKFHNAAIGKVKKISLVGDKVRVKLAILEGYATRIRTDSVAIVESPTFIGSEHVAIKPGSMDSPMIQENGEIPSQAKRSIEDLLTKFKVEETAKMVFLAIEDLSEILNFLRDPEGPLYSSLSHVNHTLANLDEIVSDVGAGKGTFGEILRSRALIDKIIYRLDTTGEILTNIEDASENAPQTMENINRLVISINDGMSEIEEAVRALKVVFFNMETGSYEIPEVARTARESIREVRDSVEEVDRVVKSLQKNILIRGNLPPKPEVESIEADIR
ncbi:MAG: MlaD family protein [Desulfobacterales bacterium]|nr:MlaD family protein [Desulfobacterales bacterium]